MLAVQLHRVGILRVAGEVLATNLDPIAAPASAAQATEGGRSTGLMSARSAVLGRARPCSAVLGRAWQCSGSADQGPEGRRSRRQRGPGWPEMGAVGTCACQENRSDKEESDEKCEEKPKPLERKQPEQLDRSDQSQ